MICRKTVDESRCWFLVPHILKVCFLYGALPMVLSVFDELSVKTSTSVKMGQGFTSVRSYKIVLSCDAVTENYSFW